MFYLVWTCIGIDILGIIFLLYAMTSTNQDSAGKGMLFLPVLLLGICSTGAYLLLKYDHAGWALIVSIIPASIILLILYRTLKEKRG